MSGETTRALDPAPSHPAAVLRVVVVEGPDAGAGCTVSEPVLVGKSEACDLALTDPTVSRRHLSLSPGAHGLRFRDTDSRNGTWHGQSRVYDVELVPGDEVRIGGTTLRVEPGGEAAPVLAERYSDMGRFMGRSDAVQPLYRRLRRAAATDATVLLEGESGTGKELLAEAIHEASPRQEGPFVVVDCGAVPETLIESELFGHEKGAFTGAERSRVGAFEAAHTGTIFLDEVGELPLAMQTRLLRALDRRQIRRLGAQRTVEVDVRVVAATNRNLEREVEESRFRLDLFHRLAVVLLRVPPLREREGDIELLARHFALVYGADESLLGPEVLSRMRAYSWPGNVRELRNAVERYALLGDDALPDAPAPEGGTGAVMAAASSGLPYRQARAKALAAFNAAYVKDMLGRSSGNVSQAARAAGVARRHFQRLKQGQE